MNIYEFKWLNWELNENDGGQNRIFEVILIDTKNIEEKNFLRSFMCI